MTLFIDDLWVCVKCSGKIKITVMDSITTCFFNWLQVTPPEMILNPFIYLGHICFLCVCTISKLWTSLDFLPHPRMCMLQDVSSKDKGTIHTNKTTIPLSHPR